MDYKKTLENGKKLSFLGLGCWRFGEKEIPGESENPGKNYWNGQKRKDSLKIINYAINSGITHFDTAQAYGNGQSEQFTGQQLRKIRDKVIIATKIMPGDNDYINFSKKIDLSLKRLNTDYIDILYLHWPHSRYDIEKTMFNMEKIRESGKIIYTGVSNFSISQLDQALREGTVDFHQTAFSFLWRQGEKDIIPYCISKNISLIGYSFYAQGILTRKILLPGDLIFNSKRKNLVFLHSRYIEKTREALAELNIISKDSGFTIPSLLLKWAESKPWLDSVLAGARTKLQIAESVNALNSKPDQSIINRIDALSLKIAASFENEDNIFMHNHS